MMDGSCNINVLFIFLWLLTLANVDLCISSASSEAQCIPSEREALLKLKHHLSDPSNRLFSWSPHGINCCNWEFVVCSNITGHILELHLATPSELYETSKFGGELHSSVLDLKDLNYLDLSGNDFGYMQIPSFLGSMASLTYLNLSHAGFGESIPLHFWNLFNLIYLDLGGNQFEGSISHQIGSLFNLIYLDFGNNNLLSGSIPYQIGNLSNLVHLGLRWNDFSGSIPHQIGSLSNLHYLDLRDNCLSGSIPHQIGNISNLLHLELGYNDFSGSIPHQIGNLSNLIYLQLQGSLQSFMDGYVLSTSIENLYWLSALSSLQYLELISVNLSNAFDWLQVLHSLPTLRELHLSNCDFNNHFQPSNSNFSSLIVLGISNSLYGTSLIPNWIIQLKKLVHLQLFGNGIQGSIRNGIQNLTLLQHLDLFDNTFNSSIPDWLYSFCHLKSLILSSNILVGEISSNIGNLTSLVTLDLSDNHLEGPIPTSMGNLCNLKTLSFSRNKCNQQITEILKILSRCASQALEFFYMDGTQLSGHLTNQIGLFKSLIELDLFDNSIQVSIHSLLGNLASLKYLNLGNNSIEGELPSSLGNLTSLRYLYLRDNAIHGAFPSWLGNLTSLIVLDLTNNQLDGNPFEILGSLSKLNNLCLGHNLFQGVVKEAHLVNFTQLQIFSASKNQFTLQVGPNWSPPFQLLLMLSLASWNLGPSFPSWIQSLNHLYFLDISNTKIFYSLPTWFWDTISNNVRYLNLSHNQIEGELSNMWINSTFPYVVVDLSSNKLHGQLPYVSHNVMYLNLSSNWFSGSIVHFLCHKQEETRKLEFLNLASNNLSGKIPDCWMTWPYLKTVNLENNYLTGILNISMGSFQWLATLNLRGNNFSGNFPTFLKNTSNLIFLDLGKNQFSKRIPTWIGQRLSNLKILVLRSNKFSGPIPHQLCGMSVLQILDLAQNELTGQIPKCIKYLNAMSVINRSLEPSISFQDIYVDSLLVVEELLLKGRVYDYGTTLGLITSLDFSCNELSGVILTEITTLKGLHFLNLSNNHFMGQIPHNIGNMKSLESMDFSRNHLSGEIPPSISELSFLSFLDLSYNNLKGKIPTGTQLQSFEASSFVGNDLCDPPLTINCTSNGSYGKHQEVDHVNGINWFFVSMAFGFIVGFWAVVGPLLFSRSWRYTYFKFINNIWYELQSC